MTDVIRVDGIRGYGYHGVLADERATGQEFFVDVAIEVDLSRAGISDELADTVDYSAVAARVLARIEGEPVDLIERLAHLVADDVDEVGTCGDEPAPVRDGLGGLEPCPSVAEGVGSDVDDAHDQRARTAAARARRQPGDHRLVTVCRRAAAPWPRLAWLPSEAGRGPRT